MVSLLLFLSDAKVDVRLFWAIAIAWYPETSSIAIHMVLAVNVDPGAQAWRDIAVGSEVDTERHVTVGHSDECLDLAITVTVPVFLQLDIAWPQVDGAGELL